MSSGGPTTGTEGFEVEVLKWESRPGHFGIRGGFEIVVCPWGWDNRRRLRRLIEAGMSEEVTLSQGEVTRNFIVTREGQMDGKPEWPKLTLLSNGDPTGLDYARPLAMVARGVTCGTVATEAEAMSDERVVRLTQEEMERLAAAGRMVLALTRMGGMLGEAAGVGVSVVKSREVELGSALAKLTAALEVECDV